jgi:long-chain fatty acid transport protein
MNSKMKYVGRGLAAMTAIGLTASTAMAGGFMIREQGALGQGDSFAGVAAGTAPSSMFFNSAAVTSNTGLNIDSSITWISPDANLTATTGTTPILLSPLVANQSTQIGRDAYVPATYATYQAKNYDPNLYLGLGINSPFGLKSEPDHRWAGSQVGGATSVFTVNFNPTIGYKFSDQFSVGVGAQLEYGKAIFKFATGTPTGPNTVFEGESLAAGATAGLMYTPTPGTRIGLGWRSSVTHELEGRFATGGSIVTGAALGGCGPVCDGKAAAINGLLNNGVSAKAELRLPDVITLSLNQAIAPNARLLGTVEWSNWSRFGGVDLISTSAGINVINFSKTNSISAPAGSTIGTLPAPWSDGWFFSGGLEYDVSKALTVRAGGAYEISPIKNASDRLTAIPDADRIWASVGFTYNVSNSTSLDFGYSHLFVDSSQMDRTSVAGAPRIVANVDASIDIVSVGVRMKLGE